MFDAGHTHGPTPHFVTDCPLCDAAKEARNRAIAHLNEALNLLSSYSNDDDPRPTLRLNLGPIGITGDDIQRCHSIDLTAKQAEALSDAIDSMNAYLDSEPVPAATEQTTIDPILVDELEKHCLGMDADFLMEMAAQNPNAAVAAFDEIFEYASYEQIMREDGGQQ